jgi:hypothetical protein
MRTITQFVNILWDEFYVPYTMGISSVTIFPHYVHQPLMCGFAFNNSLLPHKSIKSYVTRCEIRFGHNGWGSICYDFQTFIHSVENHEYINSHLARMRAYVKKHHAELCSNQGKDS